MLQFPFHLTFYAVHGSIGPPPYSSNHNQWSRGEFICIILSKTQRWYMVLLIVVHYNSLRGKHFFHGVLILFSYQTVVAVAYCWNTSASLYNGTSINSDSTSTATTGSSHFVIRWSSQNGLNGYDDQSFFSPTPKMTWMKRHGMSISFPSFFPLSVSNLAWFFLCL